MDIINKIFILWERAKAFGAGDDHEENAILSLINQMGILGGFLFISMIVSSFFIDIPRVIFVLSTIFGTSVVLTVVFNYFRQVYLSKFIITVIHPLLIAINLVVGGGGSGEESILVVSIFLIYMLYYKSKQYMVVLCVFAFTAYFGAEAYILFFGSLFDLPQNSPHQAVAFIMSGIWIIKIIQAYQGQIKYNRDKRVQLISTLQEKNANLEKTSAELEQFTYIASHDLKSPLRTIISFLGLMQRDIAREKYTDLLSKLNYARNGADQMNHLIKDILKYSQLSSQKEDCEVMIDLNTILDKIKYNLKIMMEGKNGEVKSEALPVIKGNETLYTVLFQNFIENGLKYNDKSQPKVEINASVEGMILTLSFKDNGIGIEKQYYDKIFLLFKRLHNNDEYTGTGLGLGLCKKIIENMNGDVEVCSKVGSGTEFVVRMPLCKTVSLPMKQKKEPLLV